MESRPLNVYNMDEIILGSGYSWEDFVNYHNSSKTSKEIDVNGVPLDVKEILNFIRAISRVLIHYHINKYKKEHNPSLRVIVAGSTNITSDYDITCVGKGSTNVCENIITDFRSSTGFNLADIADSNVYIAPAFVIQDNIYPKWLSFVNVGDDIAFPLPNSKIAIEEEILSVLKREVTKEDRDISERYREMIIKGKELESSYYYPDDKKSNDDERHFWKLLHNINFDAIEAYITLSTILSVVVDIQMGKTINLEPINYKISAFENIINFKEHSHGNLLDPSVLLKTSKYVYRIVHCLNKAGVSNDIDLDNLKYIVSERSNPSEELFKSEQFIKYTEELSKLDDIQDMLRNDLKSNIPITGRKHSRRNKKNRTNRNTRKRTMKKH